MFTVWAVHALSCRTRTYCFIPFAGGWSKAVKNCKVLICDATRTTNKNYLQTANIFCWLPVFFLKTLLFAFVVMNFIGEVTSIGSIHNIQETVSQWQDKNIFMPSESPKKTKTDVKGPNYKIHILKMGSLYDGYIKIHFWKHDLPMKIILLIGFAKFLLQFELKVLTSFWKQVIVLYLQLQLDSSYLSFSME